MLQQPTPEDDFLQSERPNKPRIAQKALGLQRELATLNTQDTSSRSKVYAAYFYRYLMLLYETIQRTEMTRRAAALTYATILSMLPVLAVVTSMASLFYTEEKEAEFMAWIERTILPSAITAAPKVINEEGEAVYWVPTEDQIEAIDLEARAMEQRQAEFAQNVREFFTSVSSKFRQSAGGIGIFGFIGLLVTAGILYITIEGDVNLTWRATHQADWIQSVRNFITVVLLAPIILGLSVTASGFAVTLLARDPELPRAEVPPPAPASARNISAGEEIPLPSSDEATTTAVKSSSEKVGEELADMAQETPALSPFVRTIRRYTTLFGFLLQFVPLILNCLILSLAYTFLPRVRVNYAYALLGAFVAAALWELARYLLFYYVFLSTVNRTVADALGISVVILIWIYITWLILLFGNVMVYVTQNFKELWSQKLTDEQLLLDGRLMVAVMVLLARRFSGAGGGYTEPELRVRLGLGSEQLHEILRRLEKRRYITALENNGYQIAHPPEQICVRDLLAEGLDLKRLPVGLRAGNVSYALSWLQENTLSMAEDKTLRDMITMAPENR